MKVTGVRVHLTAEEHVLAYISIVLDESFIIRDLKLIEENGKIIVAMPSKKMRDGGYRDTAHPLNHETRRIIEARVIEAYREEVDKGRERTRRCSRRLR